MPARPRCASEMRVPPPSGALAFFDGSTCFSPDITTLLLRRFARI
jgi:hypothetical protein